MTARSPRSYSGTVTEYTTTNLAYHSVYGPPRSDSRNRFRPYVGDIDGDGLMDLMVDTGTWRSLETGDFTLLSEGLSGACAYPLDFNGDARSDCLYLNAPAANTLNVGDGSGTYPNVAGFNLAASGVLTPLTTAVGAGVGIVLADLAPTLGTGERAGDMALHVETPNIHKGISTARAAGSHVRPH